MSILSTSFTAPVKPPKNPGIADHVKAGDIGALIQTFGAWRKQTPDICKVVQDTIAVFPFSTSTRKVINKAATLAAEQNSNPFHNNEHFLEVFILAATLGHRALQGNKNSVNNIGLLLSAALVHDYKHDGGKNNGQQYRLEEIAMDNAEPHLKKAGANHIDLKIIRALVLSTDVSKDFADPKALSPADSIKFHVKVSDPKNPLSKLNILYQLQIVELALMLQDADVGASLICPNLCREGSKNLSKELGIDFNPAMSNFFLEKICHRQVFSPAGRALIQPCMDKVMKDLGIGQNGGAHPAPAK